MPFHVEWTSRALKELRSIDRRQGLIVASWVNENLEGCDNPTKVGDCRKLQGVENGWRWRIGNYRILGRVCGDRLTVDIFRVGNRKSVYRRLPS